MDISEQKSGAGADLANEIYALRELVTIIVEYYCFKNNLLNEETTEDDDSESWKNLTKKGIDSDKSHVVPEHVDDLIEQSFEFQLKRFV